MYGGALDANCIFALTAPYVKLKFGTAKETAKNRKMLDLFHVKLLQGGDVEMHVCGIDGRETSLPSGLNVNNNLNGCKVQLENRKIYKKLCCKKIKYLKEG